MTLPNTDTTPLKGQLFGTPVLQKFAPNMWPSKTAKSRHFGYQLFHGRNGSEARTERVGRQPSLRFPGRDSPSASMGIRLTSGCVIFCNQPKMRSYRIPSPAATGTGMGHFRPIIRPVNQPIPARDRNSKGPKPQRGSKSRQGIQTPGQRPQRSANLRRKAKECQPLDQPYPNGCHIWARFLKLSAADLPNLDGRTESFLLVLFWS